MTPRRVAFTSPVNFYADGGYTRGPERYSANLARGAALAGGGDVDVRLITFGQPREFVREDGVTVRVVRPAGPAPTPFDQVSWDVAEALEDVDVVHVHHPFSRGGEVSIAAAALLGLPICLTDHGGRTSQLGASVGLQELGGHWWCSSEFGRSLLTTDRPVTVVRGGVDTRAFTPSQSFEERRGFLYVGALLPHKGVERLVGALPAGVPLTLCGQPYDREYHDMLCDLAAGKQVEFVTDATDADLVVRYRTALATVLPAVHRDYRGRWHRAPALMGLPLLESMACGTPVVCSDAGALPELVLEGETGFVCHSNKELADRLRVLASSGALVESMGRRARDVVTRDYDIEVVGGKALALYQEMPARRHVAAP
jgi:glycosyltransferase involved in cell wall biosynthesis